MEAKTTKVVALFSWGQAAFDAAFLDAAPGVAQMAWLGLVSLWAILAAMGEGREG